MVSITLPINIPSVPICFLRFFGEAALNPSIRSSITPVTKLLIEQHLAYRLIADKLIAGKLIADKLRAEKLIADRFSIL